MTGCHNIRTLFHSLLSYSYRNPYVIFVYESASIILCCVLSCVRCWVISSPQSLPHSEHCLIY